MALLNRGGVRQCSISVTLCIDLRFWAITPAINVNLHGGFTLEVEWLCFAVYVG